MNRTVTAATTRAIANRRATVTGAVRPQRAAGVMRAEARRIRRRGGMITGIIVAAVLGTVSAVATLFVLASLADSPSHVVMTAPLEVGGLVSALVLALASAFLVGRDANGHLAVALTLTPRRWVLHNARATAFAMTGAGVCVTVAIMTSVVGVAVAGPAASGWIALGVLLISLAGGALVLFAYGVATLVRGAGVGLLVLVGVLVVLPLALALIGGMLPPPMAGMAEVVANATPTALFLEAIAVSTIPSQAFGGVLSAQGDWPHGRSPQRRSPVSCSIVATPDPSKPLDVHGRNTMTANRTGRADAAASVALFGVILALSLALAAWTDWHVVLRGAIAIVSGIVAAAATYAIVSRK